MKRVSNVIENVQFEKGTVTLTNKQRDFVILLGFLAFFCFRIIGLLGLFSIRLLFLFIFVYLGLVRTLAAGQHQPLGFSSIRPALTKSICMYVCMYV